MPLSDAHLPHGPKTTPPRQARWFLPRPHVEALLAEGMTRRLTALVAAAGHGKTSTLVQVVSQSPVPCLWLQLDAADSNPATFLHHLAGGIRARLNGGNRLCQALEAGMLPASPLPLLAEDLAACPDDVAIVLDDVHLLDPQSPVVNLVAGLVQSAGPHVHLFLCSRMPLPFSIARLQVNQEAAVIDEADLRFTPQETGAFLAHAAGAPLTADELDRVMDLTEGWPAPLVLLAAAVRRCDGGLEKLRAALTGGTALPPDLFAYLADELVGSLPADLQAFLEETSVLNACSPAVCDAVRNRGDSGALISRAMQAGLLVTALGTDSYRYHHLLQRYLQERLKQGDGGAAFREHHRRAGDWHMARQVPEEAAAHYAAGNWFDDLARLVESLAPLWIRTTLYERLRHMAAAVPVAIKERYPWLSLCEGRWACHDGQPGVAAGLARLALRVFTERNDIPGMVQAYLLLGDIENLQRRYDTAREAFDRACALPRAEHRYEAGLVLYRRALLDLSAKGPGPEVEADLQQALALTVETGDLAGEAQVTHALGMLRGFSGDYQAALAQLRRSAEIRHLLGEQPHETGAGLAWVYAMLGRFDEAAGLAEAILGRSAVKPARFQAALTLLHLYTRQGHFDRAASVARAAHTLCTEGNFPQGITELLPDLAAAQRLQGDGQMALAYAEQALAEAARAKPPILYLKLTREAMMAHLFITGEAARAAQLARENLKRLGRHGYAFERMYVTFMAAVAGFRQGGTEPPQQAVRLLQEALANCDRRGYEFIGLHEPVLALAAAVYGLAYGVRPDVCLQLLRVMEAGLPPAIVRDGLSLPEPETRLIPLAWRALPDDATRERYARLLELAARERALGVPEPLPALVVQCLGPLTVTVMGARVDVKGLKKRKAGQVLVLLVSREAPWPREQLLDELWPDLSPDAADTSLRVSLHHLRRLLEPHLSGRSKSRYIQAEGGVVWFNRRPEARVDLDLFQAALAGAAGAAARGDLTAAAEGYETACALYRGDLYADEPYAAAMEHLRAELRDRFARALEWLGDYYGNTQRDLPRAVATFERRLALDGAYEPAHQALIALYLAHGQTAEAHRQYARCRQALADQLGVAPSPATGLLLQEADSPRTGRR